jgi:hypothetical protein
MKPTQNLRRLGFLAMALVAGPLLGVTPKYQDALKARINDGYAIVQLADGSRTMVPLASLSQEDRDWLTNLSTQNPLAHGKSVVQVVKVTAPVKNTIAVSSVEGPVETVQLVAPNVMRDQIGGTCMVYARVHWLDIAGYYVDNVDIYKVINNTDPNAPWTNPMFYQNMDNLVKGFSLPPGFVGEHPWFGGNVGHQIVVNGFTWNRETHEGTFHIINSWKGLYEFDLKTDAAKGAMDVEQSISPKGEPREEAAGTKVVKVTLIKAIGKTNLYEVDTTDGVERVAASDENAARLMVEGGDTAH